MLKAPLYRDGKRVVDTFDGNYTDNMKKCFLFLVCIVTTATIFAQAVPVSNKVVVDKIIGIVGDKIILKSDVSNAILDAQRQSQQIPDNADCMIMEQILAQKALVVQAEKDSLIVTDEELEGLLENQVRGFIQQYGGKENLEQIAGRTVYQIKEDFRQSFKEKKLAELMRNKIVEGIKITPIEAKTYFDKIPKDSLAFLESEIEVGEIIMYPEANREIEKYAIDELNDYKKQVESGAKQFKTMASLYSDDKATEQQGGTLTLNRNEKNWDPTFLSAAFRLKEGQISPVIKSKFGYHIIQMVSRAGDDAVVRHILKIPQITDTEIKEVSAKLDTIRTALVNGDLPFGAAVQRFSKDENSKFTGGMQQCQNETGSTSYCRIDQLDKNVVLMLKDLKVGEYSKPTAFEGDRGKKGVRILYLKSRSEPHRENLKDDYNRISQRALEEKKMEAVERWFQSKIPTFYIMIDEDFRKCDQLNKWIVATAQK